MRGGGRKVVRVARSRLSQFQLEIDNDVGKFLCKRDLWQRRPAGYHGPQLEESARICSNTGTRSTAIRHPS
jgi:hypothetical protein